MSRHSLGLACRLFFVALLSMSVASCSDVGPDEEVERLEESVSDPLLPDDAGARLSLYTDGAGQSPGQIDYVHVALPPGFANSGSVGVLQNATSGQTLKVSVRDGGFDPVPIAASPGDEIDIRILRPDGSEVARFTRVVPPRKPPHIVRTLPHRKRPDVPVNQSIVVVFSEPVDATTVTGDNVRLFRGPSRMPGAVRVLPGNGSMIAFTPSVPLSANSPFRLEVSRAVRDRQGEPMTKAQSISFSTSASTTGPVDRVIVTPDTVEMLQATYQLTATVWDAAGNILVDQPVTWTPYGEGIAVSQTGLVTATAEGSYDVRASVGEIGMSTHVTVRAPQTPTSVSIVPSQVSVAAQDTVMLTADVRGPNGMVLRREIEWTSSDPSIATVTRSDQWRDNRPHAAFVVGLREGTVTIHATTGGVSGTRQIAIGPPRPVAAVAVNSAGGDLMLREKRDLSVSLQDASGRAIYDRPVIWSSANDAIATVDATGVVTGRAVGSTVVTATVEGVSATVPVGVVSIGRLQAVAAGWGHACALDPEGRAYCWGVIAGWGPQGSEYFLRSAAPVLVGGDVRFTSLTSGAGFTCGLDAGGVAWCWGYTLDGIPGTGHSAFSWTPLQVMGGLTFSSIDAGSQHVCGLSTQGTGWCWGSDQVGQLGNGSDTDGTYSHQPRQVAGGVTFKQLGAGGLFSCGVTTASLGYCWGSNLRGQLGTGTSGDMHSSPRLVAGDHQWTSIDPGNGLWFPEWEHACGITTDGAAWCWGNNDLGQLGNATSGPASWSSLPVRTTGDHDFVATQGSLEHRCGITSAGAAYCWGSGNYGQLGDGGSAVSPAKHFSTIPTAVLGGMTFRSLSVSRSYSCGVTADDGVYCWGHGQEGALGHGQRANSAVPAKVAGQP